MKKHKSVVAILLAVMMVFTFMPSMAFAAAAPSWTDGYKTVSYDGHTFQTAHVFGTDAKVTVTAQDIAPSAIGGSDGVVVPSAVGQKFYYDLTGAKLFYKDAQNNYKELNGTKWATKAALDAAQIYIGVVEQPTMKDYDAHVKANNNKPVVVYKAFTDSFGSLWSVTKKVSEYDATKTGTEQPLTVEAEIKCTATGGQSQVTGDTGAEDLWGSVEKATVTIAATAMTPAKAKFYFDAVGNGAGADDNGALTGYYDGSAHTVVADEVPGWTVSYAVFGSNGKYEATNAVSITDVLKSGSEMKVRATFKDNANKQADVNKFFTVNLTAPATAAANVQFSKELSYTDGNAGLNYSVSGSKYDTAEYVAVYPATVEIPANDQQAKAKKAQNAAIEKAVAANEKLIKEWFNDYKVVKETTSKNDPNTVGLSFADKDLTDLTAEQKKALEDKYAQMLLNIGTPAVSGTATLHINDKGDDVEIEFVNSPTTKTYKAKVLKKKAKSFKVKAVATNEATVSYKLINAPAKIVINKTTGKITLKKGLKKGTYKFKVKAYIPGSTAVWGRSISETHNITVKVKK